jgi:hypothetical protein
MASLREIHSGEPMAMEMKETTSNPIFTSNSAVEDESTGDFDTNPLVILPMPTNSYACAEQCEKC